MSGDAPELELAIERLAAGGDGVGRLCDGRVAFVPFSAPGDRLHVRVVETHARFVRAEIVALLASSPHRTTPQCVVFGECGGCRWQHLDYQTQLEAKRGIVADALARVGRIASPKAIEIVASPSPYAYRGRTRVLARAGRVGYRRARSNELCAVRSCPVLLPALDRALGALAAQPSADGEWELVAGASGDVRQTRVSAPAPSAAPARGAERVAPRAEDAALRISPLVFVQSNALLVDALVRAVVEAAGSGERALELFAGAGLFTLALAPRFARIVAVESDADAAGDLARNLRDGGIVHARVVEARAEAWLAQISGKPPPDVIVLDPPRRGLAQGGAAALAALRARRIVYVSCDPATLARDLGVLISARWRLVRAHAFDLFPQTPHVEAIAVLEREA